MGVAYERVCVRMGTPPSSAGLEFGLAVVRLASGREVEDAERERVMSYLRLMDVPLPAKVDAGTSLEYARLYDSLMGVIGVLRERDRRERKRLAIAWSVFGVLAVGAVIWAVLRFDGFMGAFVALVALEVVYYHLRRAE